MKKFFMTLIAAVAVAASANAQVYVGGNVGIASNKLGNADAETTYKVLPEIGYNINNDWAIGTVIGWGKGNPVSIENGATAAKYFTVQPYVRYTPVKTKYVNLFLDGGFGYTHFNGAGNQWEFGVKPGIAVNLNQKVSFVAHIGFLGYKEYKPKSYGDYSPKSNNAWGLDLDGNNVTFGVYYNF